jgi:hypothetical protein
MSSIKGVAGRHIETAKLAIEGNSQVLALHTEHPQHKGICPSNKVAIYNLLELQSNYPPTKYASLLHPQTTSS